MSNTDSIDRVFVTSKTRSDGLRSALRLPKRRSAFADSVGGSVDLSPSAAGGADSKMRVLHDTLIKSDKSATDLAKHSKKRVSSMPVYALQRLKSRNGEAGFDSYLTSPSRNVARETTPESTKVSEWADIFDLYDAQEDSSSGNDDFFNSSSFQTPPLAPKPPHAQYRSVSGPVSFSPKRKLTLQDHTLRKSADDSALLASSNTGQVQKQPSVLRRLIDRDLMPWLANPKRRMLSSTSPKSHSTEGRNIPKNTNQKKTVHSRGKDSDTVNPAVAELNWNGQQIIEQFRAFARQTVVLQPIDSMIDFVPSLALVIVLIEAAVIMWLLYQLSVIVETMALLLRAICLPLIIIGKLIGCM